MWIHQCAASLIEPLQTCKLAGSAPAEMYFVLKTPKKSTYRSSSTTVYLQPTPNIPKPHCCAWTFGGWSSNSWELSDFWTLLRWWWRCRWQIHLNDLAFIDSRIAHLYFVSCKARTSRVESGSPVTFYIEGRHCENSALSALVKSRLHLRCMLNAFASKDRVPWCSRPCSKHCSCVALPLQHFQHAIHWYYSYLLIACWIPWFEASAVLWPGAKHWQWYRPKRQIMLQIH